MAEKRNWKRFLWVLAGAIIALAIAVAFLPKIYKTLVDIHSRRSAWMKPRMEAPATAFWKNHDADGNGVPNEEQAIQYAHSMLNIPYDPLMGKKDDFFGKAGFVVCIDVPVRSYLWAGVSMPSLLRASAKAHPEWFKIGPDNAPDNPFFYRRVRNYYDLFQRHSGLEASQSPQAGDWIFYGRIHIALVTWVDKDGRFKAIEAAPESGRVVERTSKKLLKMRGKPDFFGRIRYESK